ncbi:PAS domain S-box-containing protein [Prosthecobacter fusiformis]|uniref:histidine kinase n=1 Tax=Prosthecobacter fusiformis TaxID=48464 RepID=A0A4R7RUB0_9BACT|nr:response regulator [Prosthecobacter fusiformis]TDU69322.1 PAS domain S-box-containing protein [Prosthecobacter fusiformis]
MTAFFPELHQRILVVDDNRAIHDDFRKILGPPSAEESDLEDIEARIFGKPQKLWYEIDCASQGAEALQKVEQALAEGRPYSMAFIDVRMPPGWDGIETTGRLWEVSPGLQVVICTAYSDCSWEEMQARIQPQDRLVILKKPFDRIEVQQLANALTAKWRLAESATLKMDDLDRLVRQRTAELEESRQAALRMMEEAVSSREKEQRAHEELKREVAQRSRLEEQFREQASLLDKARDAILVRGLDNRLTYWNRSAESLYGWTSEEALGRNVAELLKADAVVDEEALQAVLARGEWVGELNQASQHGTKIIVESRWTLVRDGEGGPKAILVINSDITEKKKVEDHLLRAQRMDSIGTLAGGIAHDLNNVLLPIMMSIDLLKLSIQEPGLVSILTTIEGSAKRGADMVQQVLLFARGADGQRLPVDPRVVIGEIQKIVQDTFPRDILLRTDLPPVLPSFMGDATQVHQVLLNLCVNARDAMPSGGCLDITAAVVNVDETYGAMTPDIKCGPYVMIRVADEGTGIPDNVRAKIFDPFFTTKEVGKGTGLGLSSVAAIVKSHGGFINVYSELGGGTSFKVHFPMAASSGFSRPPMDQTHPRGRGELILVVDDEEAVRSITSQTLEAYGYRVLTAKDGTEAVALYAQHRKAVEAVLTDMMMPVMDGPSTIEVLKRMNPDVRIVAASGLNARGGSAKAAAMGIHHFLAKPYTAETILTTLRQVTDGSSARDSM